MTYPYSVILGPNVTLTPSSIARAAALARCWRSELVVVQSLVGRPHEGSVVELGAGTERIIAFIPAMHSFAPVRVVYSMADPAAGLAAVAGASSSIIVLGPCRDPDAANLDCLSRTAVDVVKQARRPVLVARSNTRRPEPYARLLLFLDQAAEGASWLLKVAQLFPSARIQLLKRYTRSFPAFLGKIISDDELREDALDEVAECLDTNEAPRHVRTECT